MDYPSSTVITNLTLEVFSYDDKRNYLLRDENGYMSYNDVIELAARLVVTLVKTDRDAYDASFETPAYVERCAAIFNNWGEQQDEELITPWEELNMIGHEIARIVEERGQHLLTFYGKSKLFWLLNWLAEHRASPTQTGTASAHKRNAQGYVYLIRQENGPWYKIGRSKTPVTRISKLEVVLPFTIEPVCVIYAEDHIALEEDLHERFAAKRKAGEWFALADDDVEYIKSLAVQG